ncbi:MAG TPA: hypothetical protein VLH39_08410, partial [Magnetospirillaceae bacterium]|nr:hypothetical protein [Magnetospirillaceae bacterium]
FASNYLDRQIRKDQAAHRRQSACSARNVSNMMSRLWCYLGWHNYVKEYPVAGKVRTRHAVLAGIPEGRVLSALRSSYSFRAFLSRLRLTSCGLRAWNKSFPTPLKLSPDYLPAFASA